jgi:hypothetical protein
MCHSIRTNCTVSAAWSSSIWYYSCNAGPGRYAGPQWRKTPSGLIAPEASKKIVLPDNSTDNSYPRLNQQLQQHQLNGRVQDELQPIKRPRGRPPSTKATKSSPTGWNDVIELVRDYQQQYPDNGPLETPLADGRGPNQEKATASAKKRYGHSIILAAGWPYFNKNSRSETLVARTEVAVSTWLL